MPKMRYFWKSSKIWCNAPTRTRDLR